MSETKTHEHTIPKASTISLVVLVVITFFTALYMKGLNSGIPYYYDTLGYSATIGGTFVAVFTLASTAMRLIGGQITDHFTHYRVLLASLGGLLLGVAIPALIDEFYVVMASRIIQGASFALATNVMTVAVMGSATKKHLGRRVGIKGAGTSLGTMLGALVSTGLLDGIGYQGFYGFYALLMVVAVVAVIVLHHKEQSWAKQTKEETQEAASADTTAAEVPGKAAASSDAGPKASSKIALHPAGDTSSHTDLHTTPAGAPTTSESAATTSQTTTAKPPLKERLRNLIAPYFMPQVAPYMAISFARRLPKGFCIAFILVFAKHADIAMGAAFFIAAGATTLVCRLGGGKLFDSNRTWLLFPLMCVQIVGFTLLCIFPTFPVLIVAAIGYGISVGTTSPFLKTLSAKATPKEHWGVVDGELYFFGDMGKAVGAFAGGLIIDATSKSFVPEIALGFASLAALMAAIALIIGHQRKKKAA